MAPGSRLQKTARIGIHALSEIQLDSIFHRNRKRCPRLARALFRFETPLARFELKLDDPFLRLSDRRPLPLIAVSLNRRR